MSLEGDSGKLSNIRYDNFTLRKMTTFTDKEIRDSECFVTLLHRRLINCGITDSSISIEF